MNRESNINLLIKECGCLTIKGDYFKLFWLG